MIPQREQNASADPSLGAAGAFPYMGKNLKNTILCTIDKRQKWYYNRGRNLKGCRRAAFQKVDG